VRKEGAKPTQPAKASARGSYRNRKPPESNRDVFINCPFDDAYKPIFSGIVFTIVRSGFVARCALEEDNAGNIRFSKICTIIDESGYGIHDISRTELDLKNKLPRFNMPLELGLFLGAARFGSKPKQCIIFDVARFRYQKFISDLAGQDIHEHKGDVDTVILEVATWLRQQSRDERVPGGKAIAAEYKAFCRKLPALCRASKITQDELTFGDFNVIVADYLTKGGATGKVPGGGSAKIALPTPRPPRLPVGRPTKVKSKPRSTPAIKTKEP
jgi:hypothetical protein